MYFFVKRLLDLTLSIFALILISPIFIIVMPILKLTGEGEIFFIQKRIGKDDEHFGLLKFATMLKDSPNSGTITAKNDPRILPIGRYLRATKINELPQILNVLKGDISIVGPRPLTDEAFHHYSNEIQSVIRAMTPGLTGLGSLIFRNEEQILFESKKEKVKCYIEDVAPLKGLLEKWYYEHRNLWVDLKIIAATALAVFFPGARFYLKWFDIEEILQQSALKGYFVDV